MGTILIVDDDESFATALGRIIAELGHTSIWAVDGQDGLAKFHDGDFDVVIADLKMPNMDGVEFIEEVKKIDREAVVMVITGYADMDTAIKTLTQGAYDYIEKPVEVEKFRAALERGIEKKKLRSQLNFSSGMLWMLLLSIPIWLTLGIILTLLIKR
jgi:DNA-binding NtrC family response regulator